MLIRPVYGSAVVLNTNASWSPSSSGLISTTSSSPSSALAPPCIAGEGRSSTSAASSRLVPRLWVATPQVTGNRWPSLTPFFSAVTISECEISSPSR